MAPKPVVRPLISAKARDAVAGGVRETREFAEDMGQDLTFVPGYSDKRRRMDADIARGRVPEERLNVRLQYVTCEQRNGKPFTQKISQYRGLGYRFVEFDNPPPGITVPVGAFRSADGRVQVGDAQLMYCDAATAARNESHGRSAIDERSTDDYTSQDLRSAGREIGGVGNDLVESSLQQRTDIAKG